ncbi:MAG: CRTAC1 family protein [Deltaproteobacteria bacterium]|nr:CRTAC1 family protein [Deltaproteobacteria bacterium]
MLLLLSLLGCHRGPEVCNPPTDWAPGSTAFRDASAAWGLDEVTGIRVSAVDYDGDGWTDLFVRKGNAPDDLAGARTGWLLHNTGDGHFEDRTEASGIRQGRAGLRGGELAVWGDVDGDGDLDLYSGLNDPGGSWPNESSELLLNQGDGTFALGPVDAPLRVGPGDAPMGASFADVDRDGDLDLWVAQYGPAQDHLYLGDGAGGFTEITGDAGLTTRAWSSVSVLNEARAHSNAWSAAACDLDDDGYPELLAASYGRAPNHLWRALGDGTWENASIASGYAFDERTDWSDNESARCWCQLHPADQGCEGVPAPEYIACRTDDDAFRWDNAYDREPFRLGGNSGSTVCRDVDNDGKIDLLTTEIVHWDVGSSSDPSELLFNTGNAVFERPGNEVTGLTRAHDVVSWNDGDMSAATLDFDNDGWADVLIASSDYEGARALLYHQDAPRSFSPVPLADGLDHPRAHGVAVADFDRDGDLDMVVGTSSMRCEEDCPESFHLRLYENLVGQDGNFLQLSLTGQRGDTGAVGAVVAITTPAGRQVQVVDGGHGQAGAQDDLTLHFGLGDACEAEVQITWPDGARTPQRFSVEGGWRYLVTQGEEPTRVE